MSEKVGSFKVIGPSLLVFLAGLVVLLQSYRVAEADLSLVNQRYGLFWIGLILSYGGIVYLLYKVKVLNRFNVFLTLLLLTIASYAPKLFLGVFDPVYFDEKIHIAHAQNILDAGTFFITNSTNPPISAYPITQSLLILISSITTLSLYTSGILLIFVCHFFTLFFIYKISRVVGLPISFAIFASMVYSVAPSFWFNGAQVSYQPVAFPVALGALFFLLKYLKAKENKLRKRYLVLYALLALITIITHHATAIILGLFLILAGVVCFFIKDSNYRMLTLLGLTTTLASAGWYILNNPTQVDYLVPSQAINALLIGSDGEATTRVAFTGSVLPLYEQVAGYLGPVLIVAAACVGFWFSRNLIKPFFLKYVFVIILISYPLSFPFTLISETNVLAHRIWPYQYIILSILAGAGLALGWSGCSEVLHKIKNRQFNLLKDKSFIKNNFDNSKKSLALTAACLLIIAMGNAALDGNDSLRFSVIGSDSKTVDDDTKILGEWIVSNYGAKTRIAGDTDTINDLHLYGKTWVVKEVPLWELTFKESTQLNDALGLLKLKNVEFFIVNTDLLDGRPARGYYYSTYEPNAYREYTGLTLDKLNSTDGLTEVNRQGRYIVYKVNPNDILLTAEQEIRLSGEISEKSKWLDSKYKNKK